MKTRLGPIPATACALLVLATGACTSDGPPAPTAAISQPEPPEDLAVAPDSVRVDLALPTFTNPTDITNPLFPVSSLHSVLLLGTVEEQTFRTEVTLLPTTRILEWEGQQVETLVSQYVAFLDGRIEEVAYDLYAQADDGSVWYFGEDVFNFADGAIADTHGTWTAGVDGPAAMIMPADPQVGDVYRPENIPGFVFEEVTVTSVDETLGGPLGPIDGGLLVEELHMDGTTEEKTFAPGYGEFYTAGGGDVEALALAVPTDAAIGAVPAELETMVTSALEAFADVSAEEWNAASVAVDELASAWEAYLPAGVPRIIEPLIDETLEALRAAVDDRESGAAARAAIDAARLGLDLQLRHRPPFEIDLARFGLWLAQLELDATLEAAALVSGDYFALDYVRDRLLRATSAADALRINLALEELIGAIGEADYEAVAEIACGLRETVGGLTPAD